MSKKLKYTSPIDIRQKANSALGWHGIADCIRDQIQENCRLMQRKNSTHTHLVGFVMDVKQDRTKNIWSGSLSLRYNNSMLGRNPIRYNFGNALNYKFDHMEYTYRKPVEPIKRWQEVYHQIKSRRRSGLYDFIRPRTDYYRIKLDLKNWPNMYYDQLFDLIEHNGSEKTTFRTEWEDVDQLAFDLNILKKVDHKC